ncbi:mechanosensitive ion channel family protein [Candidatus Gracilibacteria bacterium]|nr:mechanosensitive ion channel family protein [Candidatus Gracilibacteria bacterium]
MILTPSDFETILQIQIFGNSLERYSSAIFIFLGFWIGLKIFRGFILNRLGSIVRKTKTQLDDQLFLIVKEISGGFFWFMAFYFTIKTLNLANDFEKILDGAFLVLIVWELVKIAQRSVEYGLQKVQQNKDETVVNGLRLVIRIILWATALLLVLSNLGFNISALAASLGIGGIAIAFAAQNILADLFSSFTIYFDKPFAVGDYVIVTGPNGLVDGTVKHIGLKTTRLISLRGEEIVISNKELTESHIQNLKKLKTRRVDFQIGVTYDTSVEKLKLIPNLVKKVIKAQKLAEYGRTHFHEFGDFSLKFKIMYHVETGDYDDYLNIQQSINLGIKEVFEKEKIEMAFPTQTIHVIK